MISHEMFPAARYRPCGQAVATTPSLSWPRTDAQSANARLMWFRGLWRVPRVSICAAQAQHRLARTSLRD